MLMLMSLLQEVHVTMTVTVTPLLLHQAAAAATNAQPAQPSYEEAREELIEVVRTLEAGGTTLEESLALWERGNALADRCEEWLQGAKARLDAARAAGPATTAAGADQA